MALVTATQCARFVLLCGILEVIVGMWSCFDVFVARGMIIHMSRIDGFYMQGKSCFFVAGRGQILWAYGQGSMFSCLYM